MALTLSGTNGITFPNEQSNTKAWLKFDGSGTVAINNDQNVSSITDHNTGQYTVSYTNSFSNANYAVAGAVANLGNGAESFQIHDSLGSSMTTGALKYHTTRSGAAIDPNQCCLIANGDT